jgi:hypothetical protein
MFKQRNGPLEVDTTLVFCMLLATKIGLKSGMSVLLKCGPSFLHHHVVKTQYNCLEDMHAQADNSILCFFIVVASDKQMN